MIVPMADPQKNCRPLTAAALVEQTSVRLDDLAAIGPCSLVGDAIGKSQVKAEHFQLFPNRLDGFGLDLLSSDEP